MCLCAAAAGAPAHLAQCKGEAESQLHVCAQLCRAGCRAHAQADCLLGIQQGRIGGQVQLALQNGVCTAQLQLERVGLQLGRVRYPAAGLPLTANAEHTFDSSTLWLSRYSVTDWLTASLKTAVPAIPLAPISTAS